MTIRVPIAKPALGAEEIAAVTRVLESGMLISGALVQEFEQGLAERCGRKHAIAVANGTAALELALRALDIDSGEVLVPAMSWPSPAHVAAWVGATPRSASTLIKPRGMAKRVVWQRLERLPQRL